MGTHPFNSHPSAHAHQTEETPIKVKETMYSKHHSQIRFRPLVVPIFLALAMIVHADDGPLIKSPFKEGQANLYENAHGFKPPYPLPLSAEDLVRILQILYPEIVAERNLNRLLQPTAPTPVNQATLPWFPNVVPPNENLPQADRTMPQSLFERLQEDVKNLVSDNNINVILQGLDLIRLVYDNDLNNNQREIIAEILTIQLMPRLNLQNQVNMFAHLPAQIKNRIPFVIEASVLPSEPGLRKCNNLKFYSNTI